MIAGEKFQQQIREINLLVNTKELIKNKRN